MPLPVAQDVASIIATRAESFLEQYEASGKGLMELLIATHRLWTPSRMAQFFGNI